MEDGRDSTDKGSRIWSHSGAMEAGHVIQTSSSVEPPGDISSELPGHPNSFIETESEYWLQLAGFQPLGTTNEHMDPGEPGPDQEYRIASEQNYIDAHSQFRDDAILFSGGTTRNSAHHSPKDMSSNAEDNRQDLGWEPSYITDDEDPGDEVTKQLSSRIGSLQIAEDGQLHYYGATSNMHILHNGPFSLSQPQIRLVQSHGQAAILQAGLEWDRDAALEEHFTNLFFAWHNPFLNIVNKAIFLRERQLYNSGLNSSYYSPTLANAMYRNPCPRL